MAQRVPFHPAAYAEYLEAVSSALARQPAGGVNSVVDRALAGLVDLVGADRASFLQIDDQADSVRLTHSWTRIPMPEAPMGEIRSRLPWYAREIREGRDVVLRTEELPADAVTEHGYCEDCGFCAFATAVLRTGGRVSAAISLGLFRTPAAWPPMPMSKLRLVGEILWSGLARDHALARLAALQSRVALVDEAPPPTLPTIDGETLRDATRRHITKVLERCEWRVKGSGGAAERLDVPPSTLRFQMKKLAIARPLRAARP